MQTPLDVPLIQFGRQVRRPRRWYRLFRRTCCCLERLQAKGLGESWLRFRLPSVREYLEFSKYLGEDWNPIKVARDGCGLPTVSNTVGELAQLLSGLAMDQSEDWIWEAMVKPVGRWLQPPRLHRHQGR